MTAIPAPEPVGQKDLTAWFELCKELDRVKAAEMLLRKRIFNAYFPAPKEGTNTVVLPDTYQLKGVHPINRKVVEEAMQALCYRPPLGPGAWGPSKLEEAGISVADLIKWKPELAISAYRELTAEQMNLVDQMLLISPGTPALAIERPSKRGRAKPAVNDVQDQPGEQLP